MTRIDEVEQIATGETVTDEQPNRARRWRLLIRWTSIIASSVAVSFLFALLNVPSPALFGGLLSGVIFALTTNWRTVLPGPVNSGAQAVIGVVLGVLLELSILQSLGGDWLPVAAVIVGTLVLSVLAGLLMGRLTSVSPITGSLSLSAGGAAGITSMSRELGADERMVAVIQYLRVVLIVSTLPLVTTFVFQPPPVDPSAAAAPSGAGWALGLTFTVACALVGSLLALRVKMPAGTLLGPLILTGGLTLAGWSFGAHPPAWLAQLAYGAIGLRIGLGFTRASLKLLRKVLPAALTLTVLIILGCAGMGVFLASATGQSPLAGYLATSPGGLFAVLSIAAETGAGTTFVLAVQVLRIFVMLLVAPGLAVFLAKLRD
jgi:membrane AbrB-like protein